jgi:hypothetical protein
MREQNFFCKMKKMISLVLSFAFMVAGCPWDTARPQVLHACQSCLTITANQDIDMDINHTCIERISVYQ